ncbi:MAG TPA: hypothetical protein VFP68_14680 [Burkholderiaceae bacterium]|nr:hypothetical protein [Burkholderiaceae bacterium]
MTERLTKEWQACQRRSNDLELQYARAMLAYCRGEGPPPTHEMKVRLLALREEATELLSRALSEINRRGIGNARKVDRL